MSADKVKLYGMAGSTCTKRVVMVMEEKGIPFDFVPVSWPPATCVHLPTW